MKLSLVRSAQTVRTRRRGSILIFVVALVVLLALIGTAFLSTTGADRQSAGQHANNVQIDLITEGVANTIVALTTGDIYSNTGVLRGVTDKLVGIDAIQLPKRYATSAGTVTATPFDQRWLMPRVPDKLFPDTALAAAGSYLNNPAVWRSISGPLYNTGFVSPKAYDPSTGITALQFNRQDQGVPYFVTVGSEVVPVLRFLTPGGTTLEQYYAADADGDGIPDSGLCEVPIGTINGVTYFAAYRVIDNNSAVNVNTALSRDKDFLLTGNTNIEQLSTLVRDERYNTGSPSRVGLGELLLGSDSAATMVTGMGTDFVSLARWHVGLQDGGAWRNSAAALTDAGGNYAGFSFNWFSLGDMLSQQVARRVENPGAASNTLNAQRFGLSDGLSLVSGFVLKVASGNSRLENTLANSLTSSGGAFVPTTPYAATDVRNWFNTNFNYFDTAISTDENITNAANFKTRRPLLVTDNPMSLQLPVRYPAAGGGTPEMPDAIRAMFQNTANTPAYYRNTLTAIGTGSDQKIDINQASYSELWYGFWRLMSDENIRNATPIYTSATSTSIDDFLPQSVEQSVSKADLTSPDTAYNDSDLQVKPFLGMEFVQGPAFPPGTLTGSAIGDNAPQNPARMFRSTIGDPRTSGARVLTLPSMQVLRSAIAASNLVSLRAGVAQPLPVDARRWPTNRALEAIDAANAVTNVTPRIYGYQPQPFITEIYTNTESTDIPTGATEANVEGFVAIELYNPYDYDIDATNFVFLAVAKGSGTSPYTQPLAVPMDVAGPTTQVLRFSTIRTAFTGSRPTTFATDATIPAKGYLVIQNVAADPATQPGGQKNRPLVTKMPVIGGFDPATQVTVFDPVVPPKLPVNFVFMPNLHQVLDRELILARGGTTAGSAITPTLPSGEAAGSYAYPALPATPTLANTVPLDAYDFTGMPVGAAATAGFAWSYQRGSGVVGGNWGCVYPGRYNASLTPSASLPRHQGTSFEALASGTPDAWLATMGPAGHPLTLSSNGVTSRDANSAARAALIVNASVSSYPNNFQIQLSATDWPSSVVNGRTVSATEDGFFHGFLRIGDLQQVPYAGSYVLFAGTSTTDVAEVVPITMDFAFCEDTDPRNDPIEVPYAAVLPATVRSAITDVTTRDRYFKETPGRFTPLVASTNVDPTDRLFNDVSLDRGSYELQSRAAPAAGDTDTRAYQLYRNRWSSHLFDYFATTTPSSDVSPGGVFERGGDNNARKLRVVANGVALGDNTNLIDGASDQLAASDRNIRTEDSLGVHGMINLNTADARVLSTLPWFGPRRTGADAPQDIMSFSTAGADRGQIVSGANNVPDSVDLARAIVYYRDYKADNITPADLNPGGPFLTPFDLYRIPAFREAQMIVLAQDAEPGDSDGDSSPRNLTAGTEVGDGVRLDFEEQYLLLTRVSNLVTVRSDSFTVYMLVQGWRNAYTTSAELVTQRRQAFTIDRSAISPTNTRPARNLAPSP